MQINKINSSIPKKAEKPQRKNINNKNNTSFKGLGVVDTVSLGLVNAIENGGLAVSFTLQDMLGTNLPRPIMGLRRNAKENNGEKNLSFAAKEMVREFLTGPSMFIIPGVSLFLGKKVFGQTLGTPGTFVKSLGDIHAKNPLNAAGKAISEEEFYKNTFTEMLKNAKSETEASATTTKTAGLFAKKLTQALNKKVNADGTAMSRKELAAVRNSAINELNDSFVKISKRHASDVVHTDFTQAAVSSSAKAPFKKVVEHMVAYANDVVPKAAKQGTGKVTEFIKNTVNNKTIARTAMNLGMYAAVLGFLQVIPKLYNKAEGVDNAGLKGLMKEETFKDEALNANTLNNSDKSKPSFGSAEKVVSALTGNGVIGKLAKTVEFEGPNVSFPLLLGIMGDGILLPRTLRAKDKYDREEIVRRDVVTCAVMCFAEKALRKGFSKMNEMSSGFVLASKGKDFKDKSLPAKIFDYIRPIKGVNVLSTDKLNASYTNITGYKNGIKGFCEFITGQGGNLSKLFSLTDESREIVDGLLKEHGSDITKADNKTITGVLDRAKDSDSVKKLASLFHPQKKEAIKNPNFVQKLLGITTKKIDNPWVNKARTLNARFTALSVLVLVPVFLGFMLPAINERATKKRIREENAQKEANIQNNIAISPKTKIEKSSVFADMGNFTK